MSFDESSLIKDEISETKWINPDELKNELEQNNGCVLPMDGNCTLLSCGF